MFETLDESSVRRWRAPRMDRSPSASRGAPAPLSVAVEADGDARDAAASRATSDRLAAPPAALDLAPEAPSDGRRTEDFEAGYAAARDEAMAIAREEALRRVAPLLASLTRELERHDRRIEDELLALARAMARLILRREVRQDIGAMRTLATAALAELPSLSERATVRLHPDDLEALGALTETAEPLTLVADGTLGRGDCRIESGASVIDAGIDAWVACIASRRGALEPLE